MSEEWLHNWLYSMTPASAGVDHNSWIRPFLVGYCKNCNKTVSVAIPVDPYGKVAIGDANIPKTGCVGP